LGDSPYFLGRSLLLLLSAFLGVASGKTRSALWVWLLPTIILMSNVFGAGCADRHLNVVNETQTNAQIAARYFPTTKTSNWPDSAVDKNS